MILKDLTLKNEFMSNPFEIPNIIIEKIQLEEILENLRSNVNVNYMPTSLNTCVSNSSPTYSKTSNCMFPDFPNVDLKNPGFYKFDEYHYLTVLFLKIPNKHLFRFIKFKNVDVLVNLTTLETIVTANNSLFLKWYSWLPGPDYAIAIDNYIFDTSVF